MCKVLFSLCLGKMSSCDLFATLNQIVLLLWEHTMLKNMEICFNILTLIMKNHPNTYQPSPLRFSYNNFYGN